MRFLITALVVAALGLPRLEAKKDQSLDMKELPPAIQRAIRANLNGGEIKRISKEKENGVQKYEVETMLQGKTRDFDVDEKGTLLVMEEQTTLAAIPSEARTAIFKKAGTGKVSTVEIHKKTGQPTTYEGNYVDRKGKMHEVLVMADGKETKD